MTNENGADQTAPAEGQGNGLDSTNATEVEKDGGDELTQRKSRASSRIQELVGLLKDERRDKEAIATELKELRTWREKMSAPPKERTIADFTDDERRRIVERVVAGDDPGVKAHGGAIYDIVREEAKKAAREQADVILKQQSENQRVQQDIASVNQRIVNRFPDARDQNSDLHKYAEEEFAKIQKVKGNDIGARDPEYFLIAHERAYERLVAGDKPLPSFVNSLLQERQRVVGKNGIEGGGRTPSRDSDEVEKHLGRKDVRSAAKAHMRNLLGRK
jgi:hypothetical protein